MDIRNPTLPSDENRFLHVDLEFTTKEKECLANLDISNHKELMSNLEELEQSLDSIIHFISSIGINNKLVCSSVARLVLQISHQLLTLFQQDSAYIILRSFIPGDTENYETPRWHRDGYYYIPYSGDCVKAAIPLKGAGTLFYKPSYVEAEQFKNTKESDRIERAKLLSDPDKRESTPPGHASLFFVGPDKGAIHSEPHIVSPRFFMSVLPGSKQQIDEFDERIKLIDKMAAEKKSEKEIREAVAALMSRNFKKLGK